MAVDDVPSVAIPGELLGPTSKYVPGPGTHVYEGNVVSSLLGSVTVTPPAKAPGPAKRLNKITAPVAAELATVSVARHGCKREVLPDVSNVVLARVVRLMPKQAIVVIQQVGDTVLQTEWQGVIRVQDVRATEKDKARIHDSFKPGDIVRAQVVGFPDTLLSAPEDARQRCEARLTLAKLRFLSVTRPTTTCRRPPTSWASSWPRAKPATTWCLSAGRSTRTPRLV